MTSAPDEISLSALLSTLTDATNLGGAFSQAVATRAGLSSDELTLLELLLRRSPLQLGTLARVTGLSTPTAAAALSRLATAGLVESAGPRSDPRQVSYSVSIGPALTAILAPYAALEAATRELLTGYRAEELQLVNRFLADVIAMTRDQIAALHEQAIQS